jgi:hypothetical protein
MKNTLETLRLLSGPDVPGRNCAERVEAADRAIVLLDIPRTSRYIIFEKLLLGGGG